MEDGANQYLNVLKWLEVLNDETQHVIAVFRDHLPSEYRFAHDGKQELCWAMEEHFGFLVFSRIWTTSVSIERLLPRSRFFSGPVWWDVPSINSLVRTVVDAYCAFFYLAIDKPSAAEREARTDLWFLYFRNLIIERGRLAGKTEDDNMRGHINSAEWISASLRENEYFSELPPGTQKEYLKGQRPLFLTNQQILARAGINHKGYRLSYRNLSRYVHGYCFLCESPLGDEEDTNIMATMAELVTYATLFIAFALRDFASHFNTPLRDSRVQQIIKFHEENDGI